MFLWGVLVCAGLVCSVCDAVFGLLGFSLASAFCFACFTRRPCAGRHLLFFAAAKKSRQKKAAEHRQLLFLPEGPQRVLRFKRQPAFHCPLPTLLLGASPASHSRGATCAIKSPAFYSGKLCVGFRSLCAPLRTEKHDRCRKSAEV